MGKLQEKRWTVADYDAAAHEYCRNLPLEHFMEALPQSTQREITLESLAVLRALRPDVQVFNELLIQYFYEGQLRQVVPDNMVRLSRQNPVTQTSFAAELEAAQPFLVFEYVSPASHRKDYGQSFKKYERELRVPYCLMFYPEKQDFRIHRHTGDGYERVPPNELGRHEIEELELEVALQKTWVRFWHRGELLPLPDELLRQFQQERGRAEQERGRAEQERGRAEQERGRADREAALRVAAEAEIAQLRAMLEKTPTKSKKPKK